MTEISTIKFNKFLNEVKNEREFEHIIINKYVQDFEELFPNILIKSESEFMVNFGIRIKLQIKEEYSLEAFENELLISLMKVSEKKIYENFYKPIKNLLLKSIENHELIRKRFSTKNRNNNQNLPPDTYITKNFKKHCLYSDDFAFHSCRGKFIPVYTNFNSSLEIKNLIDRIPCEDLKLSEEKTYENLSFVICLNCKTSFLSKEIQMHCYSCNLNYLTTILKPEEILLQPATWENYHCGALLNDTMKCIKCKSIFYINLETNNLECKKCNFTCDPLSIIWTCFLCYCEFTSNAKIYNQLDFRSIDKAIKNAIIGKNLINPIEVSCCKLDIKQTKFFHKKDCSGLLYEGKLDDQIIVVCENCKSMNYFFRFIWTCPKCFKRFDQKKLLAKLANSNVSETPNPKMSVHGRRSILGDIQFEKKLNMLNELHLKKASSQNDEIVKQDISKSNNNYNTIEPISKLALNLTEFENIKGISMLRYTKLINYKTKNNEVLDTQHEDQNYNNIMTTIATIETESGENENGELSNRKNIKNENFSKLDPESAILKPKRNNSPILRANNLNLAIKEKIQLVNPFKEKKSAIENLKNKHTFGTLKKISQEYSSADIKKIQKIVVESNEDDTNHQKLKNVKINLKFMTVDNYEQVEQYDVEEMDNNIEKSNELNENEDYSLDENESDNLIPQFSVDNYRLIHKIGIGSYGSTYKCMDSNEHKLVIKKMIFKDRDKMEEICSLLNLANNVKHKNLLEIYGINRRKVNSNRYILYVLMELANYDWKSEIKKRMKENRFYSEKELMEIITQIIQALAIMQKNNGIHGDIKPENILFLNNEVKVSDFGCRTYDETNDFFVSPTLYDALNNSISLNEVNHDYIKSDVYSLGLCILYAATLSTKSIYELRELVDQSSCYNFLRKCLSNYSKLFVNLLYRLLEPNEELRFDFLDLNSSLTKSN